MGMFNKTFLQERIDATKAAIVAYEDAQLGLSSGAIQSYTIDTGQTRNTVTKQNIKELTDLIDGLYNRLATLEARRNGSGMVTGVPEW